MVLIRSLHSRVKAVFEKANAVFGLKPKPPKVKPAFKAVAGDEVDSLLAYYLSRTTLNLKIERLGGGYYMFGTKKIYCKIINGKLVVRVGGGYMGMEEFISVYGQQEVNKYALLHGGEVTAKWTEESKEVKSKTSATAAPKKTTKAATGDQSASSRSNVSGAATSETSTKK